MPRRRRPGGTGVGGRGGRNLPNAGMTEETVRRYAAVTDAMLRPVAETVSGAVPSKHHREAGPNEQRDKNDGRVRKWLVRPRT